MNNNNNTNTIPIVCRIYKSYTMGLSLKMQGSKDTRVNLFEHKAIIYNYILRMIIIISQ